PRRPHRRARPSRPLADLCRRPPHLGQAVPPLGAGAVPAPGDDRGRTVTAEAPDPRTDPPVGGSEAAVLLGFLEFHRTTFRMKTAGLTAAQRDQRLAPSGITLGGMAKHLAYVEDWWTTQVFAGRDAPEPWVLVDYDAAP